MPNTYNVIITKRFIHIDEAPLRSGGQGITDAQPNSAEDGGAFHQLTGVAEAQTPQLGNATEAAAGFSREWIADSG